MTNKIVYPYIPNTAPISRKEMMREIGIKDEMELFPMIPDHLKFKGEMNIPDAILDEYSIKKHIEKLLDKNKHADQYSCFLGAGCAPHFVPAVCDEINSRGEFLTAYDGMTMDDHGKYQAIFEYCSLLAELLEMDNLGFPVYDGSTAVSHSIRIAGRITGRRKIIVPKNMNPETLSSIQNYLNGIPDAFMDITLVNYDERTGLLDLDDLKEKMTEEVAAVYIENPSYLGVVELQASEIASISREYGAEFIVSTDPISLGVVEAPGNYGATIVCGELNSLGIHMQAGGGVAGFIALPDDMRYISNAKDLMISLSPTVKEGELGFIFNNNDRSSYIAREEANEYTGTGTNLWAITAGVYLSLMGPQGMREVGETIMKNSQYAARKISQIEGLSITFNSPSFKEFVVNFNNTNKSVKEVNHKLLAENTFGGKDLSVDFPELGQSALYCVTEVHTKQEIDNLIQNLENIVMKKERMSNNE